MRILEVNKFAYLKRGAERHFIGLLDLLESAGHQVAVFSMKHEKNQPSRWDKYFVSKVGYTDDYSLGEKLRGVLRMFYSFEAKRKISKLLDEFQPEIVHIHNIYHQLSPAILFEIKKRSIPIVMTVHDFKLISPNHGLFLNGKEYERCIGGKFYRCVIDRCVKGSLAKSLLSAMESYWHEMIGTYRKNIDIYIVPSEFVKSKLLKAGIDETKIRLIRHFMEEPVSLNRVEKFSERPYALYMGALSKEKGVIDLAELFGEIKDGQLLLAGTAEDGFELENFPNVKYIGFLNKEKLDRAIMGAKCVVSGSRMPETFGLVATEALSHGKPFFGFSSGAYSEIIENGRNGYLADNKNSLKNALQDLFSGRLVFDSEKISKEAQKKYGKEQYLRDIETLFGEFYPLDK